MIIKMHPNKVHMTLLAITLIFLFMIVNDTCLQLEPNFPTSILFMSSDNFTPSTAIHANLSDCHCLCHFVFNPEIVLRFAPSVSPQPLATSVKGLPEETLTMGVLRPPISFI